MTAVLDRPRSGSGSRAARSMRKAAAILTIGLLAAGASCSGEDVVERVTIVNRTPFDVEVQVTDETKESWLILGRAAHGSSTVNEMVADMGPTWVFRFRYGGRTVGELAVERDEPRRARWRVEVPSDVADRMRELGFEPPPDG